MNTNTISLTLIDGPTLLIEFGGLRILIDPAFDEPQAFIHPERQNESCRTP